MLIYVGKILDCATGSLLGYNPPHRDVSEWWNEEFGEVHSRGTPHGNPARLPIKWVLGLILKCLESRCRRPIN
jgi:hypothetical protein